MRETWLVFDCHYLCHRAHYIMGDLSHGGDPTGVIYGFLRDVRTVQDHFQTDKLAFCFDHPVSARKKIYPAYKAARRPSFTDLTPLRDQIAKLRTEVLSSLGFNNVFCEEGYEADDLIASITTRSIKKRDRAVIVSADKDLYQLLRGDRVILWKAKAGDKGYTESHLFEEFGVTPREWPTVKALAGCPSDNVKGIEGVGEVTACKYLTKKLTPTSKSYAKVAQGLEVALKENLPLVMLPYDGTPTLTLVEDSVTSAKWRAVAESLGMKTLVDRVPQPPRKK